MNTLRIETTAGPTVLMDAEDEALLYAELPNGKHWRLCVRIDDKGYPIVSLGPHREYLHRLVMRAGTGQIIDHRNADKLDCRKANLRFATKAQNGWNRGLAAHNKSGFKGVYFCNQTKMWRAEIRANSKCHKIGRFASKEAAARAYDAAARRLHGEFAHLNFVSARDGGQIGRGCD